MAHSSSNVFAAFLGGAILGGIAALLLTPKTGKQLREDIANMAQEAEEACRCRCHCHCDEDVENNQVEEQA